MNTFVSQFTAFLQDAEPAGHEEVRKTGASPVGLDDLIHELRQPLGVIESLTYFIELTTTDDKIAPRLEHIQGMLAKIHHMLEDASERGVSEWPAHARVDRG
jgi:signal transduction histidine kinase